MVKHWAWAIALAVSTLLIQVQLQISRQRPALPRLKATWLALRFSLARWLGVLLIPLLALLGRVLLTSLAKRLALGELDRELVVWLRVPLSILASRLFVELAAGRIIRLQIPTEESTDRGLAARIEGLCAAHGLRPPSLRTILLPGLPFAQVRSAGNELYLSCGLQDQLGARDFDFLVLRELAARPLRHLAKRVVYLAAVAAVLILPYLLAVQFTPYWVPVRAILPTWGGLFVLLLSASTWLRLRFVRRQEFEKDAFALSRLGLEPSAAARAHQALDGMNNPMPFALLTLPAAAPPPMAPPALAGRPAPSLARSLAPLALFALFSSCAAAVFLKPRYDLRAAAARGDTARVAALLDAGVDPNSVDIIANGQTPLIAAAQNGRLEAALLLLRRGADPNQFHPLGLSPLLLASERGDLPMARALGEQGANVNFKGTRGLTPLMLACVHGRLPVAAFLLSRGARIDERSKHGSTALLLAVQAGQSPSVVFLIKNGANPRVSDADGDTALGLARRKKLTQLAAFLEKAGAK